MIDLRSTEIDPAAQENQSFLNNLQGGILKSHGRDYVQLLLLRLAAAHAECRAWLKSFTQTYVTSASRQLAEAEQFRNGQPGGVFGSVFLTALGYEALGWEVTEIASRLQEGAESVTWKDGMEAARQELNDPSPEDWEEAYRGRKAHILILLADDDPDRLQEVRRDVVQNLLCLRVAEVLVEESGVTLRRGQDAVEPFGYLDGRSQPLFLLKDVEEERNRNGGTFRVWDPRAPLSLAVLPDPFTSETDACGSYMVFRKLEQNVKGFRKQLDQLASRVDHRDPKLAGAMAVGRFEDGTLVLASQGPIGNAENDFSYAADVGDRKCPMQAHIRKANPRGESGEDPALEREHRIVRRSIPYGGIPDPRALPERGIGLLFMCFQSAIARQFAFIQKHWANDPDSSLGGTGIDPLVGQPSGAEPIIGQRWPNQWDDERFITFDFRGFVRMLGGEFFFAPSIPFLLGI